MPDEGPPPLDAHLPEGREPGPQSLRLSASSRPSALLLPAMAALFIACFIGIPLAVVSVTGSQVVIYSTVGVLTVVFLVGMYLLARRHRSAAAWHFQVVADPLELQRGEEVEAELEILYPEDVAERLEVGLVCVERYDHPVSRTEDGKTVVSRETGEGVVYERWIPAWRTEELQSFRLRVPPDAPYSHEGDCLSFAWRVSAREPARGTEDGTSDDPIWVLP